MARYDWVLRRLRALIHTDPVTQIGQSPSLARVLRDQGPRRNPRGGPAPQDKGHAGDTPHGLMQGLSRSSQDSVAAKTTANRHDGPATKEARQVELAGFLRGY